MGGVNCLNFVPGIIKKKGREGRKGGREREGGKEREREGERKKIVGEGMREKERGTGREGLTVPDKFLGR